MRRAGAVEYIFATVHLNTTLRSPAALTTSRSGHLHRSLPCKRDIGKTGGRRVHQRVRLFGSGDTITAARDEGGSHRSETRGYWRP